MLEIGPLTSPDDCFHLGGMVKGVYDLFRQIVGISQIEVDEIVVTEVVPDTLRARSNHWFS